MDLKKIIDREIYLFVNKHDNLNEIIENKSFIAYHGSNDKFDEFIDIYVEREEAKDQEGPGIYFTTSFDIAAGHGKYVYKVKLTPRKLFDETSSKTIDKNFMEKLIKMAPDWKSLAENYDENPEIGIQVMLEYAYDSNDTEKDLIQQVWIEFYRYNPIEFVRNVTKLGYDGLIVDQRLYGDNDHIIIYNPNVIQIINIEEPINESGLADTNMEDELTNFVEPKDVNDGGYGGFALMPYSVSDGETVINDSIKEKINEERVKTNIGYFDIQDKFSPTPNDLFVSYLELYDQYRGKGNFKLLLQQIINYAEKHNKNRIILEPDITKGRDYLNKLTDLYKKYGFEKMNDDPSLMAKNLEIPIFDSITDKILTRKKINKPIDKMFFTKGELEEDLEYWYASDASPDNDKYKLMSEDGTSLYTTVHGTVNAGDVDMETQGLQERVKTFMPGSSAVEVKKKCKLGGKNDGTSDACDQGDINVLKFKKINESVENKKFKYGTLMAIFDIKNWNNILSKIRRKDLYKPDEGFGLEKDDIHLTLLHGFHDEVKPEDFEEVIKNIGRPIEIEINGIDVFNNEDFDVLKFNVKLTRQLIELRKKIETFPSTLTYKEYNPHITIAYLLRGEGQKYIHKFENPIKLKTKKIVFNDKNGNQFEFEIGTQPLND